MNVNRDTAVGFLQALGFKKAENWNEKQLKGKLSQVAEKVTSEDVPDDYKEFYVDLINIEAGDTIDIVGEENGEPEEKPKKKQAKKAKKAKQTKKAGKKKAKEEDEEEEEKPKSRKSRRKQEREEKEPVERDEYGARVGTIRNKVNQAVDTDWRNIEDIVEETGLPYKKVRNRLYRAVKNGNVEYRRLFQFRLSDNESSIPKAKKKKKVARK